MKSNRSLHPSSIFSKGIISVAEDPDRTPYLVSRRNGSPSPRTLDTSRAPKRRRPTVTVLNHDRCVGFKENSSQYCPEIHRLNVTAGDAINPGRCTQYADDM